MHIATTLTSLIALAAVSNAAIVERQSLSGLNVTEIPTACVSQCSVLESAIGPCESALGSLTRRSLPGLVRSLLPRQASASASGAASTSGSSTSGLTQCASTLCASNTSSSLVECLNCAVANGEPNLTASEANSLLSQLSQLCGLVGGGTISGSVTASATTTGPFTSINVASLTSAAAATANAGASGASGASGSGSAASSSTSKSASGRLEAGEAGWFVLALGAVLGFVF